MFASLASLARSQLEKWFPFQGERAHPLLLFFLYTNYNIKLIEVLGNTYYNPVAILLEEFRFLIERTISGADHLDMALKDGIVALYLYHRVSGLEDSQ